jgi:Protein of unknown function (DUF3563)
MSSLLSFITSFFVGTPPQRDLDEAYLAGSVDIHDLERRMREIDQRGRGPIYGVSLGLYVR